MIDFGLSELMLIGVIALIILGPERLPGVARMAGSVFGRAQRYVHQLRSEVTSELALDDLHNLRQEVSNTAGEVEQTLSSPMLFSGSTHEAEEHDPLKALSAAKAKNFRSRKAELRTHLGAKKNKLARRQLRSSAAHQARGKSYDSPDRGMP